MQAVSGLVKDSLGDYIKNLPIPDSFLGWFSLSVGEWMRLLPFIGAVGGIGYLTYKQIRPGQVVNLSIDKGCNKVVHSVDIEDMASDKVSYCRCWRSKKFPLCDGSHNQHNTITGDNVGPLVLKKSS